MKKLKKIENYVKKKFGQSYIMFEVTMATSEIVDTQMIDHNVREGWMNSYWKFQRLRVNRLFTTWNKPFFPLLIWIEYLCFLSVIPIMRWSFNWTEKNKGYMSNVLHECTSTLETVINVERSVEKVIKR